MLLTHKLLYRCTALYIYTCTDIPYAHDRTAGYAISVSFTIAARSNQRHSNKSARTCTYLYTPVPLPTETPLRLLRQLPLALTLALAK